MHQLPVVLIVAKEREQRQLIASHLQREGYLLLTAHDATSAIEAAECNTVALALVDLTVPSWRDGVTVCRTLRSNDFRTLNGRTGAIPLLVIVPVDTSLGTTNLSEMLESSIMSDPGERRKNTATSQAQLQTLELAEEECISMPFAWTSLRTRIQWALRAGFGHRVGSHKLYPATVEESILVAGELRIDLARREVTKGGRSIEIGKPRLFDLLVYFVRNQGVTLTQG